MKHLFAPYELALKAKEAGFDEPCLKYYYEEELRDANASSLISQEEVGNIYGGILAPLYSQIIDWFREKHKIHIYLYLNAGKDAYNISLDYTYFTKENDEIVNANLMMGYEYDKAVHVALDEAFILIKK